MISIEAAGQKKTIACDHCAIRHIAICAALGDDELRSLNAIANRRRYKAGTTIMVADMPSAYVGSIIEGVVKLTQGLSDGREQIVGLLYAADFLGRTFADVAPFSAVAVTDVNICRYPQDTFEGLLLRYPGLEERLFSDTLAELDRARDWLLLLGRKTAQERVATFLLVLANRNSAGTCWSCMEQKRVSFDLPLTRVEIADYLGLTIETVSRQLSRLKKDGIISVTHNRHISVLDLDALGNLEGR